MVPAITRAKAALTQRTGTVRFGFFFTDQIHAALSLYHDKGHIATKRWIFERTISIQTSAIFKNIGRPWNRIVAGKAGGVNMVEAIACSLLCSIFSKSFRPVS